MLNLSKSIYHFVANMFSATRTVFSYCDIQMTGVLFTMNNLKESAQQMSALASNVIGIG